MPYLYETNAGKKATNLTVNSDLLLQAKALGINISALLETALVEALRQKKREGWVAENSDAIRAYNERIESEGAFGDGARTF